MIMMNTCKRVESTTQRTKIPSELLQAISLNLLEQSPNFQDRNTLHTFRLILANLCGGKASRSSLDLQLKLRSFWRVRTEACYP